MRCHSIFGESRHREDNRDGGIDTEVLLQRLPHGFEHFFFVGRWRVLVQE